jgi:hypothetical protein
MNPGPIDAASSAAQSTIEALKSTPVVLALVIFNVLYMAGSFYAQIKQSETYDKAGDRWKSLVESSLKLCSPSGATLHNDGQQVVAFPPLPRPRPPELE